MAKAIAQIRNIAAGTILVINSLDHSFQMSELFKEFISTAREIVKILVQERNLPASFQTIPPLVTEGLAGGKSVNKHN